MLPVRKLRPLVLFFSLLGAALLAFTAVAAASVPPARAQTAAGPLPQLAQADNTAQAAPGDDAPAPQARASDQSALPGPRLSEREAKQIAAAQMNIAQVLGKHPELERIAEYDASAGRWTVSFRNPASGRTLASVVIDDATGVVVSSDIKGEAWFDLLPAMTQQEAIDLARNQSKVVDELEGRANVTENADLGEDGVWTVRFYDGQNDIAEVLINDSTSSVQEVRVGPQVAWQMARGYKGAFGRIINEPYVWLPLCVLFLVPFIDVRRPLKCLHLDLVVLLSFTVSHYFFNQGDIYTSVPLAYPPLVYIFLRMAWLGWKRSRKKNRKKKRNRGSAGYGAGASTAGFGTGSVAGASAANPEAGIGAANVPDAVSHGEAVVRREPHLNFGPRLLIIGIALLIAFRIGINIADSNVVDVGYSGVIGANLILDGKTPYGNMPSDNGNGDTYGPLNYLVYVPFEAALPWSGSWDDLPAAHATAIFFDLLAAAGMFFAGRVLARGRPYASRLGLALTWGWLAFPYTTFVLNCNVNDMIVAALIVWGFVFLRWAPLAGALLGFATQTKFFPAMLGPLWASYPRALRGWGRRVLFVLGFAVAIATTLPVIFMGEGTFQVFWEKTVGWQIGRESPFSIWGLYSAQLGGVQHVLLYVVVAMALLTYFWPLKKDMLRIAAISAALIVAFQLVQTHWFYLYIPWFFPLAFIAFLTAGCRTPDRGGDMTWRYIAEPLQIP